MGKQERSMSHFQYEHSPHPIRPGLSESYRQYWQSLASPGTWFTGAQRVAIAAEVRNALICPHCAQRKLALSPNSVKGEHLSARSLGENIVDAVHRVITDQSRITQTYAWCPMRTANGWRWLPNSICPSGAWRSLVTFPGDPSIECK